MPGTLADVIGFAGNCLVDAKEPGTLADDRVRRQLSPSMLKYLVV